ncbi:MAG: M56 family metallopeptidase [bacterium]|nr:M56 family metallopeptidase [bacterium]
MINFTMNMPFSSMVFYGSIMIAVVLVLRALLKNNLPKFVFPVLWSVVLVRLLVPFSLSSPLSMNVPSFLSLPVFAEISAENTAILSEDAVQTVSFRSGLPELSQGTAGSGDASLHEVPAAEEPEISTAHRDDRILSEHEYAVFPGTSYSQSFARYPGVTWRPLWHARYVFYFTGLLVTVGILLFQKHRYTAHLKDSLLIEHNETINTLLREMNMGHTLVFTNDRIASPLVCGLIAPKIYLPTRMDFNNRELLRHILSHEVMHIRRGDNRLKFVMLITLCIHWFNPLVWVMSKYMSADMETACDEAVLRLYRGEDLRKAYAFSLLSMSITGSRPTLLYSAFSKTAVERRVESILRYKKASAFLVALSVCFVLGSSVVFATGGQAPFDPYFTSFCSSDACRFGVRVTLTRGVSLGENAERRAEHLIFDIMRQDSSNDPDVLAAQIKKALSEEFHVETGAFETDLSLVLDRETLFAEYAKWGLVPVDPQNDAEMMRYQGETIRRFSDTMLGRYQAWSEGSVDITVIRDRLGYITDVTAFHEGDAEYDRRSEWY